MTHQIWDILIYQDKTYCIYEEPLNDYLEQADLPFPLGAPNTACWQGYFAKYVVQSNMFLTGWNGYINDSMKDDYCFYSSKDCSSKSLKNGFPRRRQIGWKREKTYHFNNFNHA